MRTIERTGQFKCDYKREQKGRYRATLDAEFLPVLSALANDLPLEQRYCDHALSGEWNDHRDCHIKPDLVLIRFWRFWGLLLGSGLAFCMPISAMIICPHVQTLKNRICRWLVSCDFPWRQAGGDLFV